MPWSFGGAITLKDVSGTVTIADSTFSDNKTSGASGFVRDGGALWLTGIANGVAINNVTFDGNHSARNGGANADLDVVGSVVAYP